MIMWQQTEVGVFETQAFEKTFLDSRILQKVVLDENCIRMTYFNEVVNHAHRHQRLAKLIFLCAICFGNNT